MFCIAKNLRKLDAEKLKIMMNASYFFAFPESFPIFFQRDISKEIHILL